MENQPKTSASDHAPSSPTAWAYEYTILLRFNGRDPQQDPKVIFLLRFGDDGESAFVVEPVGVHGDDPLLKSLNFMAEMKRQTPGESLYPDKLGAIARYLTESMEGEIFVVNKPASGPPPPGVVF